MEMGGIKREGGGYKVFGKMAEVVLCFCFSLGESFWGRDIIESANRVITSNSFALTESRLVFFFFLVLLKLFLAEMRGQRFMGRESNVWEKAWQCGSMVSVAAGAW